jgi:hypothetical protein
MPPGRENNEESSQREPFGARWTGALAVGLFCYILAAIGIIFVDGDGGPFFDVFNLFSDSPANLAVVILAAVAARKAADPAVRRTWQFLTAAIAIYSIGNLLNSTYWLFGVDPFPSATCFSSGSIRSCSQQS